MIATTNIASVNGTPLMEATAVGSPSIAARARKRGTHHSPKITSTSPKKWRISPRAPPGRRCASRAIRGARKVWRMARRKMAVTTRSTGSARAR